MRTVLFAGGGTLGSVTPLLAVAARLRELRPDLAFAWAGTDDGPERDLVESTGMPFFTVPVAKLPRYLTWKLLTAPYDYLQARRGASRVFESVKPSLVISAGGFTAVPVVYEAAARHLPSIAHQLDYVIGLSNRMVAKHCRYVTTSFPYPAQPFRNGIVSYRVPTPCRFSLNDQPSREFACRFFGFDPEKPVLLVTGGGTGAKSLNDVMYRIRHRLPQDTQILHLTGRGKSEGLMSEAPGYVIHEFLGSEMQVAYAAADLVVSRAGFGAISELAALKKTTILVPLPDSPQLANAAALHGAASIIDTSQGSWRMELEARINALLLDRTERERLGEALHREFPTDRGEAIAGLAASVLV